ncbi:hypothetical protein EB001_12355 [bacterium]|nr:hypothetical protein [bacterium]
MDIDYYIREYDWCSNRLELLNDQRLKNMNMVPPVNDKTIISELVGLIYKRGLLQSAINNPSDGWSVYDHLLYLHDHPELRKQEEEPEYDHW